MVQRRRPGYGYADTGRVSIVDDNNDQDEALRLACQLVIESVSHPIVRTTALQITNKISRGDDREELQAIYDWVKKNVKYVNDPTDVDFFTAPYRLLDQCTQGACAEDCDGHSMLIAAMCKAIGFEVALRTFQPEGADQANHIYALAALPKLVAPGEERDLNDYVVMDTTVEDTDMGWEPSPGKTKTIYLP